MNEFIKQYTDQGLAVFACNPDKTPATKNGFYDASKDYEVVNKQFYKEGLLIGLPTGQTNRLLVIDFDVNKKIPGTNSIDTRTVDNLGEEIVSAYGPLPDTFQVETPSGGRHCYYRLPEGVHISSGARFFDRSLPIDIRCEGGYVIAPDEENYIPYDDVDGKGIDSLWARCNPAPAWILSYKKQIAPSSSSIPETVLPASEVREIRSALSFVDYDDRDEWVKAGLALKSTGSPSAFPLWDEWSSKSTKYKPSEMESKWNGFKPNDITIASLFHMAKQKGWVTTYSTVESIDTVEIPDPEKIKQIQKEFERKKFPDELLRPPGLVGDIIDYILSKSIVPQPIFALSAALCAVGTLAGRKVQTETGIRSNIYCLNVGGSGSGKEAPRKAIKDIFQAAGCGHLASVEELASDSSMITAMKMEPSQLFLIDEVGRFLAATKNGSSHLTKIVDVLLKMYSSADQIYYGKNYADATLKQTITQPNLCLLGTTVPDTLYKGLDYSSATDGFMSRMLIFETDNNRPRKDRNKNFLAKPGKDLIDQVVKLFKKPINVNPQGNLDHLGTPEPQVVKKTEDAKDMIYHFEDYIHDLRNRLEKDQKNETVYNRASQMAEQIALIVATGINSDNPAITAEEMAYGISLSKHLADHVHYIVENYMAKNELEHEVKRVLNAIRSAGCLTMTELSQKTQNLNGSGRNDVIETLKSSGQIYESAIGNGRQRTRMFTAI